MASYGSCRIDFDVVGTDGFRVGVLRGELDAGTLDEVRSALAEVVEGHAHLVLDLEDLTFLSAAGVRLFLDVRADCRARGGDLTVRNPRPLALRVFTITKTDDLLERGRDTPTSSTEPAS